MNRLNLAIRRMVWLIGIMPVMFIGIAITVVGAVFPLLWCGLLWLIGSRKKLEWDWMSLASFSASIIEAWDRLIEVPADAGKESS